MTPREWEDQLFAWQRFTVTWQPERYKPASGSYSTKQAGYIEAQGPRVTKQTLCQYHPDDAELEAYYPSDPAEIPWYPAPWTEARLTTELSLGNWEAKPA